MPCAVKPRYLPDREVDPVMDARLMELISSSFPDPCFRVRRYCHEMPAHRWIVTEEPSSAVIAHVAGHEKEISHPDGRIRILGIAEVCVRPDYRGRGYVRTLLAAAHRWGKVAGFPYAMLFGNPEVYSGSGYFPIANPIHRRERDGTWISGPMKSAMACPLSHSVLPWPQGEINLRGPLF